MDFALRKNQLSSFCPNTLVIPKVGDSWGWEFDCDWGWDSCLLVFFTRSTLADGCFLVLDFVCLAIFKVLLFPCKPQEAGNLLIYLNFLFCVT
jgi:hypothetical protein